MVSGRSILFLLLFFGAVAASAQPHVFTEVKINKSSVFVGEPVEVSVIVYTSTWFTKGINPGNIKVEGAYTVYFRGISVSKKVNGKTYAGVTMIFNVFPYAGANILFPSLEFTVETPDEGGYKGVQRTARTEARTIKVKPVPKEFSQRSWLVATGVEISDRWKGNKDNVKVGDVLERSITQTVAGTVAGLVPPVVFDAVNGVSIYPDLSSSEDIRFKTSVSAKRTDGVKYLFEKEGKITIPGIEITWWNAQHKKLYKRTLKAEILTVQPNPDLEMLISIRDSLNAVHIAAGETEIKDDYLFMGLTKRQLAIIIAIAILTLIMWKSIVKWLSIFVVFKNYLKNKRAQYLHSEHYYFRIFLSSAAKNDRTKTINTLYQWIDQLDLTEPSIRFYAKNIDDKEFYKEVEKIQKQINTISAITIDKKQWLLARKNYLKRKRGQPEDVSGINP